MSLNNQPNWLKSVKVGDELSFPIERLSDWLIVMGDGSVYGGYTIQYMRAGMETEERAAHDQAWGIQFGDPEKIWIGSHTSSAGEVKVETRGLLKRFLGRGETPQPILKPDSSLVDHPAACNMAPGLVDMLAEREDEMLTADEEGWMILHWMALGGSAVSVDLLLRYGVDPNLKTKDGMTPLALAGSLGWDSVCELLRKHGAR